MDQSTKGDVRTPGFNTLAIHAGAQPDPTTGARATPIYQTTSFVFDDVDHAAALFGLQTFGNIYSRITNPTCAVLEERVAALEGGTAALAVASGHAAQVVAFHNLLTPGDEFIASKKLYGGSINQFNHAFKNFGWNVVWADPDDIKSFESAVSPKTKAIFIESIANPGGVITDIEAVGNVARRAGVPLIVDNTLATPSLQAVRARRLGLRDIGPALSPFNAFLILTGIETLPLRMQRHCDNALKAAEYLASHKQVAWVSYPGLNGDRYNQLAKRYVPKGSGAVFTFGLKGGYEAGIKLVSDVKLFSHLANVGDTRSLIIHPASTTHRQLSDVQKIQAGAGPDVVRLSVGLEDPEDIIADLDQGLAA